MAPDSMEDLRSRVVAMEHRGTEIVQRLMTLEEWKNQKNVSDAEIKIILATLVESMKGLKGGINKILFAIGISVLIGIVTWIMSGGLASARREVSNASIFGYPSAPVTSFVPMELCPAEKPVRVAAYCRAYPNTLSRVR